MKKFMTIMLILFMFGIVGAGSAAAQKIPFYAGISALYAYESLDTQQTKDKFSGPIEIDFDNAWGFQIRGGYICNRFVSVEALAEHVFPFEAKTGNDKDRLDVTALTLNAKLSYPNFRAFQPFVVLGVGAMNAYEHIEFGAANSKTSKWGLAFRGGLGFDIPLTKSLALNLEGAYVHGGDKTRHVRYTAVSLGFNYRF